MKAPFSIDRETGRIRFPDISLELPARMAQADFVAATSSLNRDNLGANDGWQRYSIRELIPEDRKLGIFLVFFNGRLKLLTFAYAQKDESWANWSKQAELAQEKEYQQELRNQLGDGDTFPWGKAGVRLDSKAGGLEIWVNFSDV